MLDGFIIEELKRREEQERDRAGQQRPVLELPIDDRSPSHGPRRREDEDAEAPQRGVIVIDI